MSDATPPAVPQSLPPTALRQRRLALQGAVNFRDLGGYPVGDGWRTAWGRLYRSDSLADLTAADLEAIHELGLRNICDLRDESERAHRPSRFHHQSAAKVHPVGFLPLGSKQMWRELNEGLVDAETVRGRMHDHYRRFALAHASEYRKMLEVLLKPGAFPALIHCAAGKDRTGFGTAIILMTLGASRETIVEDYLLSDGYRRDMSHILRPDLDTAALNVLMGADAAYMAAAFTAIDETYGSEDAFLKQALHVTDAERGILREALLEPAPA